MKSLKLTQKSLFLCAIFLTLFIISCKTQNEVPKTNEQLLDQVHQSMKSFGDNSSTEYRGYPAEISFFDPVSDANDPQLAILKRKEFIKQSGLPDETNIFEFQKTKPISLAFSLYTNYINQNLENPYTKTFKQYGAWLILTRLDLLAQSNPDDLKMICSLTEKLVETEYSGYQLLSYNLNKLYTNKFNRNKIKTLSSAILQYAEESSKTVQKMKSPVVKTKTPEKPLPPSIMERLKSYNENKDQNRQNALTQIKELVAKL